MKKNKLSLDNFKVQSFVTSLSAPLAQTAKGGDPHCDTVDQCSLGAHLCEEDTICVGPCQNSQLACETQVLSCFETFNGDTQCGGATGANICATGLLCP